MKIDETARNRDDLGNALIIGAIPVACSLILYFTAFAGTRSAGWLFLPGIVVGLYAGVIASGNTHGGSLSLVVAVSAAVNYFVYVALSYLVFRLYRRLRIRSTNRDAHIGRV